MTCKLFFDKIDSFYHLPKGVKLLFFETFILSLFIEFALRFLSFKFILKILYKGNKATTAKPKMIRSVKIVFKILNKNFPIFKCYNNALTARIILYRRGVSSMIFIGFKRDNENKLKGHAWLRCNEKVVTGEKVYKAYTVTSIF